MLLHTENARQGGREREKKTRETRRKGEAVVVISRNPIPLFSERIRVPRSTRLHRLQLLVLFPSLSLCLSLTRLLLVVIPLTLAIPRHFPRLSGCMEYNGIKLYFPHLRNKGA